ncbi:hypothetical protein GUJ93_ZPchr0012g21197 [Zizania palustris]|uniref:Uncharacterized protein n=1 Tax=Zizania palustris TaxID=103762 RepID=A0A8J6BW77_ZIZPA|nr:hypothetical protein GUJ93_ZPchr0012g21197 [Zizania palustris]
MVGAISGFRLLPSPGGGPAELLPNERLRRHGSGVQVRRGRTSAPPALESLSERASLCPVPSLYALSPSPKSFVCCVCVICSWSQCHSVFSPQMWRRFWQEADELILGLPFSADGKLRRACLNIAGECGCIYALKFTIFRGSARYVKSDAYSAMMILERDFSSSGQGAKMLLPSQPEPHGKLLAQIRLTSSTR